MSVVTVTTINGPIELRAGSNEDYVVSGKTIRRDTGEGVSGVKVALLQYSRSGIEIVAETYTVENGVYAFILRTPELSGDFKLQTTSQNYVSPDGISFNFSVSRIMTIKVPGPYSLGNIFVASYLISLGISIIGVYHLFKKDK